MNTSWMCGRISRQFVREMLSKLGCATGVPDQFFYKTRRSRRAKCNNYRMPFTAARSFSLMPSSASHIERFQTFLELMWYFSRALKIGKGNHRWRQMSHVLNRTAQSSDRLDIIGSWQQNFLNLRRTSSSWDFKADIDFMVVKFSIQHPQSLCYQFAWGKSQRRICGHPRIPWPSSALLFAWYCRSNQAPQCWPQAESPGWNWRAFLGFFIGKIVTSAGVKMKRSMYAGRVRKEHVVRSHFEELGCRRRDLGGLIFIDLRDARALQLVINPEDSAEGHSDHKVRI